MGDIYHAIDTRSGERLVVKLLRVELVDLGDFAERMRIEGEALELLSHPHVVRGRGHGTTREGRAYVAMERLLGRTLRDEVMLRGALGTAEAIRYTMQLLSALHAVHEAGLVHRDVKPENIMVCEISRGAPRCIKLLDFGIAKVARMDSEPVVRVASTSRAASVLPMALPTQEGVCVGTPRYISPEQASFGDVDRRTDVYAAGLVLYGLLAGRGPFDEIKGASNLLKAHLELDPPPPSRFASVPQALDDMVLCAIAKEPRLRFADTLSFRRELWTMVRRLEVAAPKVRSSRPRAALPPHVASPTPTRPKLPAQAVLPFMAGGPDEVTRALGTFALSAARPEASTPPHSIHSTMTARAPRFDETVTLAYRDCDRTRDVDPVYRDCDRTRDVDPAYRDCDRTRDVDPVRVPTSADFVAGHGVPPSARNTARKPSASPLLGRGPTIRPRASVALRSAIASPEVLVSAAALGAVAGMLGMWFVR